MVKFYKGINEEYLKDHFITAYFIDNERKNIEVVCNEPDFKTVFTSIVKYEDGDDQWEELKKVTNIRLYTRVNISKETRRKTRV